MANPLAALQIEEIAPHEAEGKDQAMTMFDRTKHSRECDLLDPSVNPESFDLQAFGIGCTCDGDAFGPTAETPAQDEQRIAGEEANLERWL